MGFSFFALETLEDVRDDRTAQQRVLLTGTTENGAEPATRCDLGTVRTRLLHKRSSLLFLGKKEHVVLRIAPLCYVTKCTVALVGRAHWPCLFPRACISLLGVVPLGESVKGPAVFAGICNVGAMSTFRDLEIFSSLEHPPPKPPRPLLNPCLPPGLY